MSPSVPRVHLFEIDDQSWFPSFLRVLVQNALTEAWKVKTPLQSTSAAHAAASVLIGNIGDSASSYTFIDFCAGGGGPTPHIERVVNAHLRANKRSAADFVLTDLRPNVEAWDRVARKNPRITYESASVDASEAPKSLVRRRDGKKVMRLFNLAFHHFDDLLARQVIRDTVDNSHGFAIFELQDRSLNSVVSVLMLSLGSFLAAPVIAWKMGSLAMLFFSCFIPILPFVLLFDGLVSSLRTRTPEEIEALLRRCGGDTESWEVRSGTEKYLWPCGYMNWVICRPRAVS